MTKRTLFYCMSAAGKPEEISGASAIPVNFSALRALEPMDDTAHAFLGRISQVLCASPGPVAVYGSHDSISALLELSPGLRERVRCRLVDYEGQTDHFSMDVPTCLPAALPPEIRTIYFNVPGFQRARGMRKRLREGLEIVSPEQVGAQFPDCVPMRAWAEQTDSVYPLDIPEIVMPSGLDFLLLDLPAKNMGFMPNGLAYVHNELRRTGLRSATFDLDIVVYHRFHMRRLLDAPWSLTTRSGSPIPEDPWRGEHANLWKDENFRQLFEDDMEEFYAALIASAPRIVGFTVHEVNAPFVQRIASRLKVDAPEVLIVAGGYSCLDPTFAHAALPVADYTVVGEAEVVLGPLLKALIQGERPKDLPGIISRRDTPGRMVHAAEIPENLDALPFPDYEWFGTGTYRNYDGYQLIPITKSRGCKWSRCTFCTERFPWRTRSATSVADELEWHWHRGGDLFLFNDSDFNADHGVMRNLCKEIENRKLYVRLTGQLRIDRRNTLDYFKLLRKAGFVALHFGVDAWSKRSLITARKGYTTTVIRENLKACYDAGLFSEINLIVAYPGETEEDVDETIANILEAKKYIGRIAVINPLMMKTGCVFWERSEEYGICFVSDKRKLALHYPTGIPSHYWYSTEPLLDEALRNARVLRVVKVLEENGISIGEIAAASLDDMEMGNDLLRGSQSFGRTQRGWVTSSSDYSRPDLRLVDDGSRHFLLGQDELRDICIATGIIPDEKHLSSQLRKGKVKICEAVDPSTVLLVSEGVRGYNIIQVGRQFAAIRQGVPFDPLVFATGGYPSTECIQGSSVVEVFTALEKILGA